MLSRRVVLISQAVCDTKATFSQILTYPRSRVTYPMRPLSKVLFPEPTLPTTQLNFPSSKRS